ncbi:MAG: protein kinase [Planctomycetales bacterium]|nr:protein kinase [Planctomycetales bacterium]
MIDSSDSNDSSDQVQLDLLADEFVTRLRHGEAVDAEQYAERWPALADEIRELFPAVEAMERLKRNKERSHQEKTWSAACSPQRIGDFRLLHEIGRGGMGIVYEAVQESLGRHVALKVLPHPAWDERRLRRFQREARMAAKLHHTNIVPVLGVGEDEGHHFIVMQFIRGVGLDEILAALIDLVELGDADAGKPATTPGHSPSPDSKPAQARQLARRLASSPRCLSAFGISSTSASKPSDAGSTGRETPTLDANDDTELPTGPNGQATSQTPESPEASEPETSETSASICGPASRLDLSGAIQARAHVDPAAVAAVTSADESSPRQRSTWLDRRSPLWNNLARIGIQAAEALDYAHRQGTTHRDVKPGNLLLDESGRVWVADFGLAIEHESSYSNDVAGTLRYMAPEQLLGESDPRSDVYSLGLTLYELITLRPAFDDQTRRRQLAEGIADSLPELPSLHQPVPRDLETIVLKAVDPDPKRRYQTAAALAEDLLAFVEHRPIQARRVSWLERGLQWCRRNKALAAATALAATLMVAITLTTAVAYYGTHRLAIQAQEALQRETEQRHRAESTLDISLEALDRVYRRFAPDRMRDATALAVAAGSHWEPPPMPISSADAAMLEDILSVYDRFAEQQGDSHRLKEEAALANWRVAEIQRRLGNYDRAEAACLRAIDNYRQLAESPGDDSQTPRLNLVRVYNELGVTQRSRRDRAAAANSHRAALRELRQLGMVSRTALFEAARTDYLLALAEPADDRRQRSAQLERAIGLLGSMAEREYDRGDARYLLAACYTHMEQDPFGPRTEQAVSLLEELVCDFPQTPDYRFDLIVNYVQGDLESSFQRKRLETRLRRALEHSRQLVAEHPNVRDYIQTHAHVLQRMAVLLDNKADTLDETHRKAALQEAEDLLQLAVDHQMTLADRFPAEPSFRIYLANIECMLAEHLVAADRHLEARQTCEQAIRRLYSMPPTAPCHGALADLYAVLATAHDSLGDSGEAADAFENLNFHQRQQLRLTGATSIE